MIHVIYDERFANTDYSDDAASVSGRMESIITSLQEYKNCVFEKPEPAPIDLIKRVHNSEYVDTVKSKPKLFEMALLAAGAAVKAADNAYNGKPSFAVLRPPGHHAYKSMGWGYCHFCNMAVAMTYLKENYGLENAFILDFDAHTGDGTIDCLRQYTNIKILNPMAENSKLYLQKINNYITDLSKCDVIGVSAGFDSYELDLGKKLSTFDFYVIGRTMKQLSKRISFDRRFALLEGGYYLPDLGKNVLSFCQGFEKGDF